MGMKKGSVVNNFNNLSKEVTKARTVLNKAAIDTKAFDDAVKNVVKVEEEFNKELICFLISYSQEKIVWSKDVRR